MRLKLAMQLLEDSKSKSVKVVPALIRSSTRFIKISL